LCRYVGDSHEAKDLLNEVFLRLVKEMKKGCGADMRWRPWLYRVASNCAISYLRRQKVRRLFLAGARWEGQDESNTPQQIAQRSDEGRRVKEAVMQLGEKHRSVLVMRIYQEMSYQEIAEILEINIGTVKSRINEAKSKIRHMLEGQNG